MTYPCEEFFDSRLFFGRTIKRKKLMEEINNLKSVLLDHGKDLNISDVQDHIKIDKKKEEVNKDKIIIPTEKK